MCHTFTHHDAAVLFYEEEKHLLKTSSELYCMCAIVGSIPFLKCPPSRIMSLSKQGKLAPLLYWAESPRLLFDICTALDQIEFVYNFSVSYLRPDSSSVHIIARLRRFARFNFTEQPLDISLN